MGNRYQVYLENGVHLVAKNKTCSCGAKSCPAVEAVHAYLMAGGERAPVEEPADQAALAIRRQRREDNAWRDFQARLNASRPERCPLCGELTSAPDHACAPDHYICRMVPYHYWEYRLRRIRRMPYGKEALEHDQRGNAGVRARADRSSPQ